MKEQRSSQSAVVLTLCDRLRENGNVIFSVDLQWSTCSYRVNIETLSPRYAPHDLPILPMHFDPRIRSLNLRIPSTLSTQKPENNHDHAGGEANGSC